MYRLSQAATEYTCLNDYSNFQAARFRMIVLLEAFIADPRVPGAPTVCGLRLLHHTDGTVLLPSPGSIYAAL